MKTIFVCKTCGKREDIPEDEDWLICCGRAMQMARSYTVRELLTPTK